MRVALMPVVMPVVMIHVVPINVVAARHAAAAGGGEPAGLAPLPPMRLHAGFDLGTVRDELSAQPHRIRRASLLSVLGLGAGRAGHAEKDKDRQRQPEYKTHTAHGAFPFEASMVAVPN
jgi:hypothetical protein